MGLATHRLRAGLRYAPGHQLRAGLVVLLIEGAGTKVLGLLWVSIQPEAGGQLGEVRAAVSWEWLPGAPCVRAHGTWTVHGENSSCGRMGTACICRRVVGVFGRLRDLLLAGHKKKKEREIVMKS